MRVHEWRENYKLVLVWEHQRVRLGLLVNLRDRSMTTRLATEGVLVRVRRGRNRLHIAPVRVSRGRIAPVRVSRGRLNPQIGRVRLGLTERSAVNEVQVRECGVL